LIFSGSQGSNLFSQTIPASIEKLDEAIKTRLVIIQQARPEDVDAVKQAYSAMNVKAFVQPFFSNMIKQYQSAHLIISRAGASTVAEITAVGRPAIFIPFAASLDGDQAQNASHLVKNEAGWMIEEKNLTPEGLSAKLAEILTDTGQLQKTADNARNLNKPGAAGRLVDIILKGLK